MRTAIAASGFAWRVRHTATQIEMLLVPAGTYTMGCTASATFGCDANENPTRQVTITNAFYIGRFEVTQAQWTARMGSNPSNFQSASAQVPAAQVPNRPVESVSWTTVQGFLAATGMRLPTEAEWEYASRAGTTTAFNNGSSDDTTAVNIAWYNANALSQTRPVGGKAANALGLHDMSGNVWEWVSDWFGAYAAGAQTNPTGPATGTNRVLRSGSWFYSANFMRSSARGFNTPGFSGIDIGFRVARNP
jgi:formylglycine-generating enzyme required for sulfatase activity